jgi:hypothetical protein
MSTPEMIVENMFRENAARNNCLALRRGEDGCVG